MNEVRISKETLEYKEADLFMDNEEELYILTYMANIGWYAICLSDGLFWLDEEASKEAKTAVEGLTFVGRNAEITITFGG